jgi:hypothetical protein
MLVLTMKREGREVLEELLLGIYEKRSSARGKETGPKLPISEKVEQKGEDSKVCIYTI